MGTPYKLFIDDERMPPDFTWRVARSSLAAISWYKLLGPPSEVSLDHDLGGEDTTMVYIKYLAEHAPKAIRNMKWKVHSQNPVGTQNIISFMQSWYKSAQFA